MSALKSLTSDNVEHGLLYTQDESGLISNPTPVQGSPSNPFIDLVVTSEIDGFWHTHFAGGMSVFSPHDIYAVAMLFHNGLISDLSLFTFGLASANGTQYLMKVENEAQFLNFIYQILEPGKLDDLRWEYETRFGLNPNNSNDINELRFLNFLQSCMIGGTGLKLFKGNVDCTDWQPIKSENNIVVNAPCL